MTAFSYIHEVLKPLVLPYIETIENPHLDPRSFTEQTCVGLFLIRVKFWEKTAEQNRPKWSICCFPALVTEWYFPKLH